MDDIDEILGKLRNLAIPDKVWSIDGAALAATARAVRYEARSTNMIAAALALVVGVAGSALPTSPAAAAIATPFGLAMPLAPSTLLIGQP